MQKGQWTPLPGVWLNSVYIHWAVGADSLVGKGNARQREDRVRDTKQGWLDIASFLCLIRVTDLSFRF